MIIITCFGDPTCGTSLGLSDEDNSVSRKDNFVDVFNSVTSPSVLSYHCVLRYFLTMSVGFYFKASSRWHQNCTSLFTNDPFSKLSGS